MSAVVAYIRSVISNAIYGYGCMLKDHAGVVDAIAKALAQRAGSGEAKPVLFFKDASSSIWIETGSLAWLEKADPIYREIFETRTLYTAPPAAVQSNPIDGYGGLCIGPDRDGVKPMLYAPMDYMTEISKAIHAWRNKQLDSGRDAARYRFLCRNSGQIKFPLFWTPSSIDSAIDAAMAAQQGEQAPEFLWTGNCPAFKNNFHQFPDFKNGTLGECIHCGQRYNS